MTQRISIMMNGAGREPGTHCTWMHYKSEGLRSEAVLEMA